MYIVYYHSVELIQVLTGIQEDVPLCTVTNILSHNPLIHHSVSGWFSTQACWFYAAVNREGPGGQQCAMSHLGIPPICILYVAKVQVKCPLSSIRTGNKMIEVRQYMCYGTATEIPQYKFRCIMSSVF